MTGGEELPGSESDLVVEQGETYEHSEHGEVTVTGIWRGVNKVDNARHTDEKEVIIVRYSTEKGGEQVDELTDTLSDFLDAIE